MEAHPPLSFSLSLRSYERVTPQEKRTHNCRIDKKGLGRDEKRKTDHGLFLYFLNPPSIQ